jgi:hypothetical protein
MAESVHVAGPLEHFDQVLAPDTVALRLPDMRDDDRTPLAPRLAAATLLLRFQVEQFA